MVHVDAELAGSEVAEFYLHAWQLTLPMIEMLLNRVNVLLNVAFNVMASWYPYTQKAGCP